MSAWEKEEGDVHPLCVNIKCSNAEMGRSGREGGSERDTEIKRK